MNRTALRIGLEFLFFVAVIWAWLAIQFIAMGE